MNKQNVCNFIAMRSADLICERFVLEKNLSQSKRDISRYDHLCIVTKGAGYLECDSRWQISVGDLFFVARGESFSIGSSGELEYCYICFQGRRADELIKRMGLHDGRRIHRDHVELVDFWLDSLRQADAANIDIMSEGILLYTMARLAPIPPEKEGIVTKIISVTNDCFTDSDFNLKALSAEIGYDEKYVSSVFKKQKGMTYSQYLRDMRIKRATFLMEQGLVSVKNIALLSGFSDPLYFSKVFKAVTGESPRSYIERIGEGDEQSAR